MTRWLTVSILLTLAALGGSLYTYEFQYDRLPEKVPIHWNIRGVPDRWVPKHDVIWNFLWMPAAMAGIVVLTAILPWLSPKQFDVDRFRDTYGYLMTLVVDTGKGDDHASDSGVARVADAVLSNVEIHVAIKD